MSRRRTGTPNARRCRRRAERLLVTICAGALLACSALHGAEAGYRDPEFARVPFDKWVSQGGNRIHWTVSVPPVRLSTHQRLLQRVTLSVDGKDIEKRRGEGELLAMIQYRDSAGRVWQNHTSFDLATAQPGVERKYLEWSFFSFLLPGDYTLSVAVCDSKTLEHSASVRKLHIDSLKGDPLPDSWEGLPAVEMISPPFDPPDVWYLPDITTGLTLRAQTQRPLRVRVILNTTPSQRSSGSLTALRANMNLLIPALKVLTRMQIPGGMVDAEMVDLTHQKVIFSQKDARRLDWPRMRAFFVETRPGVIDAAALSGQWKMRRFFFDEVNRQLSDGSVVIVLSGPAFLEDQEPVEPGVPFAGAPRLFYIRYRSPIYPSNTRPRLLRDTMMGRSGRRPPTFSGPGDDDLLPPMPTDDLERAILPLNARIFDAASAKQFRRVLAALLDQLSKLP
ncbi:MAG TPA: hypothetical protein VKB79_21540 [Bryobacteraceae bacterium]|nr:hypothetical protein [Bryobacteraceae bacterium]